jgi:hypothetical protein
MFERYTEPARRLIFFARYEASQCASPAIEPEHILMGSLRENRDLLVKLTSSPDPVAVLRKSVEHLVSSGGATSTSVELPLSPGTKDVLTRAHEESDALGHRHIGPEHLLLGLFSDNESFAAKALEGCGINAERIRNLINIAERETSEPGLTLLERVVKSIFECLDETFVDGHEIYLDKGSSLFPTLEGVSAQEASSSVSSDSATLAAQVEHIRFYLDVLNDEIRSKPIVKVDWEATWRFVNQVTPEEWEGQKRRLRESYDRIMTTLKGIDGLRGENEIAGALSVLSHTAYHLGGIRQALRAIRAARQTH